MKLLVVHPGVKYSTGDVYDGFISKLQERHEVIVYRLDGRVQEADHFLAWRWKEAEKRRKTQYKAALAAWESSGEGERPEESTAIPQPQMPEAVRMGSMTLLEAAMSTLPDWVVVFSGMFLHPDALICLFRTGAPTAVILSESPYDDPQQRRLIAFCDVAFTNERASVPVLRRESYFNDDPNEARIAGNRNTHYLPHAFDPKWHGPTVRLDNEDQLPRHDVVFIGSGFSEREEILLSVDWDGLGIDLGLYGQWPYMPKRSRLRKYLKGGVVDNRLAAALYRNAKVGLNIHRQSIGQSKNSARIGPGIAESVNPRVLELAADGVPMVSDSRAELVEILGDNVATFDAYLPPGTDPNTYEGYPPHLARAVVDLLEDSQRQAHMRRWLPKMVKDHTFDRPVRILEQALEDTGTVRQNGTVTTEATTIYLAGGGEHAVIRR